MNQNYDVANAPARLSALIDKIPATAPTVELFVARSPRSRRDPGGAGAGLQRGDPRHRGAEGAGVTHLVDMHAALTTADLADGVHPNAAGYDKMAARWFAALQSVPGSLAPAERCRRSAPPSSWSTRSPAAAWTSPAPAPRPARSVIWDCHGGTNQRWTRTAAGELRVYGDRAWTSTAAAPPTARRCRSGPATAPRAQRFTFNANGSIVAPAPASASTSTGGGTANGTQVQLYDCNGTGAQRWSVR